MKELSEIQKKLMDERDFQGLIIFLTQQIASSTNFLDSLKKQMMLAYCTARIGKKVEAEAMLKKLGSYRHTLGPDEYMRMCILCAFFIDNNVDQLTAYHLNTIRSWIQDPECVDQVLNTVFDYEDFI